MLQKLVVTAPEEVAGQIARQAGVECTPFNGAAPSPGTVVVVLRPRAGGRVEEAFAAVRKASVFGVPVLVVAGVRDAVGEQFLREAEICGVPGECVLFVDGGRVVDAAGTPLGDALRGTGIGVSAVVSAAERAVKENLIPEIALWEGEGEEEALWEPDSVDENSTIAAGTGITAREEPRAKAASLLDDFFAAAEGAVAVFGVKSGVGATTVAACLAGVLADRSGFHLEIAPSPTGYVYYGSSPLQAVSSGQYAFFDGSKVNGEARRTGILVADVSVPEAVDAVYDRAGCVVVVADGSPVSFRKVQSWIKGGWRLDVLVVNRVVPGAGYPPEVYAGEFGLERVIGIPGGLDEEAAVNQAQHSGALPLGKSVDLDTAVNELAAAVLEVMKIRKVAV